MRKSGLLIGIIAGALSITGCAELENQYGFIQSRGGVNGKNGADTSYVDKTSQGRKKLYAAAIDEKNGDIIVFADGQESLRFPYGEEYEVSPETDMHHIIDGSLYSEYISDSETILKRDGKEILRYKGREIIKGIYPSGSNIYTLAQKCDEEGFSYRRNGKALMTSDRGQILGGMYDASYKGNGALYKDAGALCFCYFKSVNSENSRSGMAEWHLVKDCKDYLLTLDEASSEIFDLRLVNGIVCYVSTDNYSYEPVLHIGGQAYDFTVSKQTPGRDYRLCSSSGGISFTGSYTSKKGKSVTYCQSLGGVEYEMEGSGYIIYDDGEEYAWVQYLPQQITIHSPTCAKTVLSGSYEYLSCWDGDFSEGELRVAVSPCDRNKKPFIWDEGAKQEYDFKGKFASIGYY